MLGKAKLTFCWLQISFLLAGVLPGCGGGGDKPKPNLKVQPSNALKVVPTAPTRTAPPVVTLDQPKRKQGPVHELQAGESVFVTLKEPNPAPDPRYLYAVGSDESAARIDTYAVVAPAPGVNSTSFVVVASPANEAASRASIPLGVRFPAGFVAVESTNGVDGLPGLIRCQRDGSLMALVPAGSYVRGSDSGPAESRPSQRVGLDHFYMDVNEVTSGQFEQARIALRREKKAVPKAAERRAASPNDPVTGISWGDAVAYARWCGKELPTEAQWEKAARGREGFEFPWGNGVPLWHRTRSVKQIDPVGSHPSDKSPFGILDLAGNAREWCADWYSPTAYADAARKADSRGLQNPTGPAVSESDRSRVIRGGDPQWRVWTRGHAPMIDRPIDVGFRCVLSFRPDRAPAAAGRDSGK